ncbi:hypothetical protein LB504_010028 [Fusarium proliferatum]|nr:hypothetical protein LB504_010028 [Fusarium proliferatum]
MNSSQITSTNHVDSQRNFSELTVLGFSCAVLVIWEGIMTSLAPGLENGGPAGLVYGFNFIWLSNLSVFSILYELISIIPIAGTYSSKVGLVVFIRPFYNIKTCQGTLIAWLMILLRIFINTIVSSLVPKIEGMVLIMHILGFFSILITLLTLDAIHVFELFRNTGDWSLQGLSLCIGLMGSVFPLLLCKEVRNPSIAVPRSIVSSIVINSACGLAIIIAILFTATDINKVLDTSSGYPSIKIVSQAT